LTQFGKVKKLDTRARDQVAVEDGYCGKALPIEAGEEEENDVLFAALMQQLQRLEDPGAAPIEPVVLIGDQQVHGSDVSRRSKEETVRKEYGELVLDLRPKIQDALFEAVEANPTRVAMQSWNDLRTFARTFPCCYVDGESGQQHHVRYHPSFSNHEVQFKDFRKLEEQLVEKYQLKSKSTYSRLKPETKSDDKEAELYRYAVHWNEVRDFIKNNVGVRMATGSTPLTPVEIKRLEKEHPDVRTFVLRLNVLQRKVLHCNRCLKPYWDRETWVAAPHIDNANQSRRNEHLYPYVWGAMADKITRAVIETCVSNAVVRAPKNLIFKDEKGAERSVALGGGGDAYGQSLLGEAVLSGFRIADEITVKTNGAEPTEWTAFKSDQNNLNVFVALGTQVVERLAGHLQSFYTPLAAALNPDGLDREKWCKSRAAQLLYAVQRSGALFTVEKSRNARYLDGSRPKFTPNMIRLNNTLHRRIQATFVENGTNLLQQLYQHERLPPMIYPPAERQKELPDQGGFLTPSLQAKKTMISDSAGRMHQDNPRFSASDEAIDVINALQKTTWKVDSYVPGNNDPLDTFSMVKTVLEHELRSGILHQLKIVVDGKTAMLEFEDIKNVQKIRHGQVREWYDTFDFIERLTSDYPGKPHFWHAWQFDWRGRMNTMTPMLSPQNDDVCRGLLRFAKPVRLDESGLKWLGRFTVSLCMDLQKVGEMVNGAAYVRLLSQADDKVWSSYDAVAQDPLFMDLLDTLLKMPPLEGYVHWGQGHVFRKKAEGFQRYAAMKEFHRVMNEGGVGAEPNLPVHLDASSSIYQHASAMLKDTDMGQKVNVVAQEDGSPADVYMHVVKELKAIWEKEGFLNDVDLDESVKMNIKTKVLQRHVAKGPVMTKGYGAGTDSMVRVMLTHNGDENGEMGLAADGDTKVFYAHEDSTLGFMHEFGVDISLHWTVATEVVNGFNAAITSVLPSFGNVLKLLKSLVNTQNKKNKAPLSWTLPDGSKVTNIKWKENKSVTVSPWSGARGVRESVRSKLIRLGSTDATEMMDLIPSTLTKPVQFDVLEDTFGKIPSASSLLEFLREDETARYRSFLELVEEPKVRAACSDTYGPLPWDGLRDALGLATVSEGNKPIEYKEFKDVSGHLVDALKTYLYPYERRFSYQEINLSRDLNAERRGIAPNFVHSFDALHMRRFVRNMQRENHNDLWSVHDSFGCHANHVEKMRDILQAQFITIHHLGTDEQNVLWTLMNELMESGEQPKYAKLGTMSNKDVNSAYFVN